MNILFLYHSVTGNTKKVIDAMYQEVKQNFDNVEISNLANMEYSRLSTFDVVVFGAPCHHARLSKKMYQYLENLPQEVSFKYIGVYTHSTEMPTDEYKTNMFNEWAGSCERDFKKMVSKEKEYLSSFHCMGKASFLIEKFIQYSIIKDKEKWKDYKPRMRQTPTNLDIAQAKTFILDTLNNL